MPFISKLVSFWKNVFRQRQVEQDLDDELRACVDEIAERNLRQGMAAEDARAAAIQELGGIDGLKQKIRSQHIGRAGLRSAAAFAIVALVFFGAGAGTVVGIIRWGDPQWVSKVGIPTTASDTSGTSVKSLVSYKAIRTIVRMPSTVEGRVSEKETGKPLSNVNVQLRPDPRFTMFTTTDEWGQFAFLKPPPGHYTLSVGTKTAEISVDTQPGAHMLVVPRDASFTISMKSKPGKPLKQPAESSFDSGIANPKTIVSFSRDPRDPPFRIIRYIEGEIEIGIPTSEKR